MTLPAAATTTAAATTAATAATSTTATAATATGKERDAIWKKSPLVCVANCLCDITYAMTKCIKPLSNLAS
jgi:hypothetical protein